jgi:hypothetical protein
MAEKPNFMATRDVPCLKCGAKAGEPCKGKGPVSFHQARHDAWAAKNVERN